MEPFETFVWSRQRWCGSSGRSRAHCPHRVRRLLVTTGSDIGPPTPDRLRASTSAGSERAPLVTTGHAETTCLQAYECNYFRILHESCTLISIKHEILDG